MPLLLLVRHGETAWNAEHRWQGHYDAPLSPLGRVQAEALAARIALEQPAALYSSDLPRARETAEEIARRTGLEPVYDERWREVDVGEWLGLGPEEAKARHPEGVARWLAGGTGWEQGETYPAMAERGLAAARALVDANLGATAPVVCVTHGGVIRSIVMHVLGRPPSARRLLSTGPTATITMIDAKLPVWRLRSFNDAGHLPR
jgi:broad specificity phosphatase PhoE